MEIVKKILSTIGGLFIVMAIVIVVGNILKRSIFGVPLQGSYEMTALCAVLFVSVSISMCTLAENHIQVDFLVRRLPRVPKMTLEIIAKIFDCIFGVILTYAAYIMAMKMIDYGQSTETLSIPEGPFRLLWTVCAALIIVFSIINIFRIPAKYKANKTIDEIRK